MYMQCCFYNSLLSDRKCIIMKMTNVMYMNKKTTTGREGGGWRRTCLTTGHRILCFVSLLQYSNFSGQWNEHSSNSVCIIIL